MAENAHQSQNCQPPADSNPQDHQARDADASSLIQHCLPSSAIVTMVGIAGRSKACNSCRRRRIKCGIYLPLSLFSEFLKTELAVVFRYCCMQLLWVPARLASLDRSSC